MERIKVSVLFERLGPYHIARLNAIAEYFEVTVIESTKVDNTYAWTPISATKGFKRITLFESIYSDISNRDIVRRVKAELEQCKPTVVVIPGWSEVTSIAALDWSYSHGVPAVVMSESTAWDSQRTVWKEEIKKCIIAHFSAGLVGGSAHQDYLTSLGLPKDRIYQGYDAVDNLYFQTESAIARAKDSQLRAQYQLPQNYFLASARFVEKKNLLRLIDAYAAYKKQREDDWKLVLLGDGPLKNKIEDKIHSLNLDDSIMLPGFIQYQELPIYYGLANVFIHASTTEQWGLVVNEAMASGLPVLVSKNCGCFPELVEENVNGYGFDPYNVSDMTSSMLRISASSALCAAFGQASNRKIQDWGPKKFAQGFSSAVQKALECRLFESPFLRHFGFKLLTAGYSLV